MLKNKLIGFYMLLTLASCKESQFPHGQRSYEEHCATCHMEDGSGLAQMVPSLYFTKTDLQKFSNMPCMIRLGVANPDSVFQMVANPDINSIDITNVINYIANDLNKLDTVFTLESTEYALQSCPE